MKFIAQNLIVIALMPVCLAGCFDRDREMINRKSDGTDTFKYKPTVVPDVSPVPKPEAEIKPNENPSAEHQRAKKEIRQNDAKEFKYTPHPVLLKQMKNDKSK